MRQAHGSAREGCVQCYALEWSRVASLEGGVSILKEILMFWLILTVVILFLIFMPDSWLR